MAAPRHHEKWDTPWHKGRAWVYGRMRKIRYQQVLCQWAVSGYDELVHAFVFEVEGYDEPWFLVTTAKDLSGEQVVAAFAARFRQEDGFPAGGWVSRSQATLGYGGVSGLDQGTCVAHLPGADGGDDAAALDAVSPGRRRGRGKLLAKTRMESTETTSLDP